MERAVPPPCPSLLIPLFPPIPPFFQQNRAAPHLIFTLFPSFLPCFPLFPVNQGKPLFYHLCPPISPFFQKNKGSP